MKADDKSRLFGWKATGGPNFSLMAFFFCLLFESKNLIGKVGKILHAADRRQFWPIFGKIWSVLIFEPHEEWSWNFQDSILFMKASYGSSFYKIWSVNHGHFRNSWWFDMEWPTTENMKFSIKDFFSKCDQICCFLRIWSHLLEKP